MNFFQKKIPWFSFRSKRSLFLILLFNFWFIETLLLALSAFKKRKDSNTVRSPIPICCCYWCCSRWSIWIHRVYENFQRYRYCLLWNLIFLFSNESNSKSSSYDQAVTVTNRLTIDLRFKLVSVIFIQYSALVFAS